MIRKCKISRLFFIQSGIRALASSESGLERIKWLYGCMWHFWNENQHFQNWGTVHLSRNPVQCSLQVGGVPLKEVKNSNTLGAFRCDKRQDEELDVRSGKVSTVMRALHHSIALKRSYRERQNSQCLINISSHPHLRLWILGYDWKSAITNASVRNQIFCKSKQLRCLTNFVTMRIENLSTSIRCFSESKDLSFDGLAISAECLREGFLKKLSMLKWIGRGQLDDHKQDGFIISRIVVGMVWDFVLAKCSLWW